MIITVVMQDEEGLIFHIDPLAPTGAQSRVEYPSSMWSPGARKMVAALLRVAADQVDPPKGMSDGQG